MAVEFESIYQVLSPRLKDLLIISYIQLSYTESQSFEVKKRIAKKNIQGREQMVDRAWEKDVFNVQNMLIWNSDIYLINDF